MTQVKPNSTDMPLKTTSTQKLDLDARPQDFRALDKATDRILNASLPPAPYIVSVDGSIYSGRSAGYQWTLNSPFSPEEGHLQYQSLLYRDTSTSLLRLRAAHEDEEWRRERAMKANGATVGPSNLKSGANTPLNAATAAKKKMSLSDYKSRKEAGSQGTTPTAQSQPSDLRKDILKKELSAGAELKPVGLDDPPRSDVSGRSTATNESRNSPDQSLALDQTQNDPGAISEPRLHSPHPSPNSKRPADDIENERNAISSPPAKKRRSMSPEKRQDDVESRRGRISPAINTQDQPSAFDRIPETKASGKPNQTEQSLAAAHRLETSENDKSKTPLILVSTPSPTDHALKTPDGQVSSSAQAERSIAPLKRPAVSQKTIYTDSTRANDSSAQQKSRTFGDHDRHEAGNSSPENITYASRKSQDPDRKQVDLNLATLTSKEKGLRSWLPRISFHGHDEHHSWLPASPVSAAQNRTPPELLPLLRKDSMLPQQEESSATGLSKNTKIVQKDSPQISSDQVKPDNKVPSVKNSALSSSPSPEQRPVKSAEKIKNSLKAHESKTGDGTKADNDSKAAHNRKLSYDSRAAYASTASTTQIAKVVSNPPKQQEPVNGIHKGLRMVKVNAGSSSFFKNLEQNKKPPSTRVVPTLPAQDPEETFIVKLKYGKHHAKDVESLLRLKPVPQKDLAPQTGATSDPKSINTTANTSHQRLASAEQKKFANLGEELKPQQESAPRKRPATEETDPHQPKEKRQKSKDSISPRSPQTPQRSSLLSPSTATPARGLHQTSPPSSKDLKSARRQTEISQGISDSPGSIASAGRNTMEARSTSDPGPDPSPQAWKTEYETQIATAKKLRTSHLDTFKNSDESVRYDEAKRKTAAVEGLESVLCFMKAFTCHARYSHDRKASVAFWESNIPWIGEVARSCEAFPHLQGFAMLLRSVCCSEVLSCHSRLAAPERMTSYPAGSAAERKILENTRSRQRYAVDSERLLPRKVMAKDYPESYEECLLLPLSAPMNSEVALKVGYKFLIEWTSSEGIPWTLQSDASYALG